MNKEINEIIRLCLALDKKAFEIYGKLAETGENDELNQFWNTMCDEEHNHVEFWERLQKFAQEGMIPQVFDNAWQIIKELKDLIEKVDTLFVKSKKPMSTSNSLLLAYKLEFYLLHPALGTLFNFVRLFDDHKNPADEYDHHISMFLEALNKYGSKTPEIEYLAEALQRLWHENKILSLQSTVDDLTGVLNRRGFFNVLKPVGHMAQRSHLNLGIMMIDIDYFKEINDTYGHQKGDEALKLVAKILQDTIRSSDVLGRYGGEEFIICFMSIKPTYLKRTAEKIRISVEKKIRKDLRLTVSIGVSHGFLTGKVDKEISSLINKADSCMYEAKNLGRNRVVMCE